MVDGIRERNDGVCMLFGFAFRWVIEHPRLRVIMRNIVRVALKPALQVRVCIRVRVRVKLPLMALLEARTGTSYAPHTFEPSRNPHYLALLIAAAQRV